MSKHLTAQEYASRRNGFTIGELALLLEKTTVRIWQLAFKEKAISAEFSGRKSGTRGEGSTNRRGVRIPRSEVAKLKKHFKLDKLNFAQRQAAQADEALGQGVIPEATEASAPEAEVAQ